MLGDRGSWDTFLFAGLAVTGSQETGFQRLQGTFHHVGNESTTNVPWQAALKEGEWKVHLVTNTILICITEAPSTVNSFDNTINTNSYIVVLRQRCFGPRRWDIFHPYLVSHSHVFLLFFLLFFNFFPPWSPNYLRKCTFPCMKAIITMTPFSVSALCNGWWRGGGSL